MLKYDAVKLVPVFKDYLWGGERLKTQFNKRCELSPLAESWELSAHRDGESKIAGGEYAGLSLSEYIERIGKDALGNKCARYEYFPLLVKLIDAKGDLSVQVHPSDEYALETEGEYGKTEMWYVLDCEEGASLYYGFSRTVTKEEYANAIEEGRLTDILNRVPVKKGDVFFIPSGTVHAIGAGILICEIQQNSNTTYRVYDYMRRDAKGELRPLHIDKALEVSCLEKAPEIPTIEDRDDVVLAECEYFAVRRLRVDRESALEVGEDSFVSLVITEGEGRLVGDGEEIFFNKGDSIFIPAQKKHYIVFGKCEIIISKVN